LLGRILESSSGISVGVGGWAYFPIKSGNRLALCAKIYDFVEVNSSFYKLPPESLARKWRAIVPEDFQFSFRANRKLTHENHLEPREDTFREYERNLTICRALQAFVLHFQFPPSFEVTSSIIQGWRSFFGSAKREKGLYFAMEVRNPNGDRRGFQSLQEDYDIIPTSDPSRGEIGVSRDSRILYSRIFGPGEHTKWSFSTRELEELKQKVSRTPARRRYLTFHNMSMYEDGARLKNMLSPEGKDLEPTLVGIDALKQAVIAERIHFPILSQHLSAKLAWRTVGTFDGRQVHVDEIMKSMGNDVRFESLGQILEKCGPKFPRPAAGQRN
jgi:uncharacterized protein YecE (DUF72 family)